MIRHIWALAASAFLLIALLNGVPEPSNAAQSTPVAGCSVDAACLSQALPLVTLPEWPDYVKPASSAPSPLAQLLAAFFSFFQL